MEWGTQEVVLLRRARACGPMDMDWPLTCFKLRVIGLRVLRRFGGYLGAEDAGELFAENMCRFQSRALAQWVFEGLVVGVVSGNVTSVNCAYVGYPFPPHCCCRVLAPMRVLTRL